MERSSIGFKACENNSDKKRIRYLNHPQSVWQEEIPEDAVCIAVKPSIQKESEIRRKRGKKDLDPQGDQGQRVRTLVNSSRSP